MIRGLFASEKFRYLIFGGINTALGFGLFSLCQFLFGSIIGYLGSLYLAQLIASIIAFVNYRKGVFRVHGNLIRDFVKFQSVYIVPLLLNTLLLPILVQAFQWNVYVAQGITTFVLAVGLYFAHKHFSFKRSNVKAQ